LLSFRLDALAFPELENEASDEAPSFSDEERSLTLVESPAAGMRSSLAIAAAAAGMHRERDIEGEMDAIMGDETAHLKRSRDEAAHLKRRKVDDHLFDTLVHGMIMSSHDWDDESV
jgi:hypothetical protein